MSTVEDFEGYSPGTYFEEGGNPFGPFSTWVTLGDFRWTSFGANFDIEEGGGPNGGRYLRQANEAYSGPYWFIRTVEETVFSLHSLYMRHPNAAIQGFTLRAYDEALNEVAAHVFDISTGTWTFVEPVFENVYGVLLNNPSSLESGDGTPVHVGAITYTLPSFDTPPFWTGFRDAREVIR